MAGPLRRVKATLQARGQRATLSGHFVSKFKRPVALTITIGEELDQAGPHEILTGSKEDVGHIINGLAQVAWDNGWRPPGLAPSIAAFLSKWKPLD